MIVHSPEGLSPLINPAANAGVKALFTDIIQPQAPIEHRLSPEELKKYGLESPPPTPTGPFVCLLPGTEKNTFPDLRFTVGSDELVAEIHTRNAQQEALTNPTVRPTATEEYLFPPTPEEGVRAVNCNLKVMKGRLNQMNKGKTFKLPSGRVIPIEKVLTGLYPRTNGNCVGDSAYLEPEFISAIGDEVIADPNVEKNWDPNETTGGEYGNIMRKCQETAKSIFKLFPTSMKLAYDKVLELVYDKADKQCEWTLNDNPDYVPPTPTKTPRPTWAPKPTSTP